MPFDPRESLHHAFVTIDLMLQTKRPKPENLMCQTLEEFPTGAI